MFLGLQSGLYSICLNCGGGGAQNKSDSQTIKERMKEIIRQVILLFTPERSHLPQALNEMIFQFAGIYRVGKRSIVFDLVLK